MEMTVSPLTTSKGVPSGVVVVGTDITKKQMSEYEFEQFKHYATLGEISLGLSHDVKNPLMNIRSCVTLLKRSSELGESGGGMLETIGLRNAAAVVGNSDVYPIVLPVIKAGYINAALVLNRLEGKGRIEISSFHQTQWYRPGAVHGQAHCGTVQWRHSD